MGVSAAIFSSFRVLSRVFKTIFPFVAFITALSGEKLNIEKWPELGSGQKYVTLPYNQNIQIQLNMGKNTHEADSQDVSTVEHSHGNINRLYGKNARTYIHCKTQTHNRHKFEKFSKYSH